MTRGPWDQAAATVPSQTSDVLEATAGADRKRLLWNLVSTLLTAGFLTMLMGPIVALAGVVGIFVHEYGHVLAMNAMGCGPARIHIVPFLGGAAVPARNAPTEFKGVLISLAGPIFGLVALAPFFGAYAWTGDKVWLEGALFIAFINLLNLAPAPPLDGSKAIGPVLAKAHPNLERAALVIVGALAVWWALQRNAYIFAIFVGISVLGALRRGALRPFALKLTNAETWQSTLLYVAAVALCTVAMGAILVGLERPPTAESLLKFLELK
jgi:Zn-dependent protease